VEKFITIIIAGIFIQNVVLHKSLGIDSLLGTTNNLRTSYILSISIIFSFTLISIFSWTVNFYFIKPSSKNFFDLINIEPSDVSFLRLIFFALIVAFFTHLNESFLIKFFQEMQKLGIHTSLAVSNTASLGIAFLNVQNSFGFWESTVNGLSSGIGYALILIIIGGINEKLEISNISKNFKGAPVTLITLGILSMAFIGFSGLVGK
jgi:electron transport complex protein RnfA